MAFILSPKFHQQKKPLFHLTEMLCKFSRIEEQPELGSEALKSYLSGEHQTLKVIKLKTFGTMTVKEKNNHIIKVKDNLSNEVGMLKKVLLANEYHIGTKSETFQHLLSQDILL